ncbi:MAG: DUF501 domain-containing protein, partial [Aquificae bacterium]|nr:DUF501 domain-containing protein [Aquificota bacterium]
SLHQREIQYRKKFLQDKDYPEYVVKKLLNTGIGGIQDYDKLPFKVKCLHLWTGYHLGDRNFKNPIGKEVLNLIGFKT